MLATFKPSLLKLLAAEVLPSFFLTEAEKEVYPGFLNQLGIFLRETGYAHIQATRPDTVGKFMNSLLYVRCMTFCMTVHVIECGRKVMPNSHWSKRLEVSINQSMYLFIKTQGACATMRCTK